MTAKVRSMSWIERLLLAYARRPLTVRLQRRFGSQPNDRDMAEEFCLRHIGPALARGKEVVIDFANTGMVTQSFIHAP